MLSEQRAVSLVVNASKKQSNGDKIIYENEFGSTATSIQMKVVLDYRWLSDKVSFKQLSVLSIIYVLPWHDSKLFTVPGY
jgi:hypothetical protein